jgi:class 3 adenylate cyclase/CheY-like chemotaxis protein
MIGRVITPHAALLVVDDNEDNRYTLTRRLKRLGYGDLSTANDGRMALELLRRQNFDLVLLDISMPELNGYEVLEQMKADAELRHIPVIMISAIEEIASVVRCIELGAEDYLPKPFDPTLLRARVHASLEKKALRDEVRTQAAELAQWNRNLEQRVQEQLAQLDRLGKLKGFFSPQLVDSILGGEADDLLKTHRREVVVVFADMRGFTAFTDESEPEEVMAVLADYHAVMGPLILAHEGTLERFAGDGMMIFFNDPVRLENPGASAVRMALAMQEKFQPLRAQWLKRGYELDLGMGIAQGYATLGAIGFEGRWDYACIGGVTNLAARMCSEAKGGQILTNRKTLSRIEELVHAEPVGELMLKGIGHPTHAFNITGLSGDAGQVQRST